MRAITRAWVLRRWLLAIADRGHCRFAVATGRPMACSGNRGIAYLDGMTTAEIVDRIDSRLVALEREIASLQAARAALGAEGEHGERASPVASANGPAATVPRPRKDRHRRRQQPASGRSNGAVSADTPIALLSGSIR